VCSLRQVEKQDAKNQIDGQKLHAFRPIRFPVAVDLKKVLEIVGGKEFYRSLGLKRLLRDLQASYFYPLPEKEQQIVTGRTTLGLEPIAA
jgi:hypothetical protein